MTVRSLFFQEGEVVLGTESEEKVSDGLGLHVEGQVDTEVREEQGGSRTVQRLEWLCLRVGQLYTGMTRKYLDLGRHPYWVRSISIPFEYKMLITIIVLILIYSEGIYPELLPILLWYAWFQPVLCLLPHFRYLGFSISTMPSVENSWP